MTEPFTRPCDGNCGDASPHDAHLTAAGRARYTGTSEEKNMFHDAETPATVMGELAGYSSVCWAEDGTFQSERVAHAVDQALDRLEELGFLTPENKEKNREQFHQGR